MKCLCVCVSRKIITSSWEFPVTTWTTHNHPLQLRVSFDGSRLVFHGSISVFIGFQWFRLVLMVFSWFQVGFYGFSWFKVGFSWFFMIKKRYVTDTGPQLTSMIKKRDVTNTGPNRPFRCLDFLLYFPHVCWWFYISCKVAPSGREEKIMVSLLSALRSQSGAAA